MAQYATNAGPKQAQRLFFINISYFCETFKNVNYGRNGNFSEEWCKAGGALSAVAGTGAFVPHTKGPVKTDKKISLSVDEKQPP